MLFDCFFPLLHETVPAGDDKVANYSMAKMLKYLDWVNIMTYDYNGAWSKMTSHNAPLKRNPANTGGKDKYNIASSLEVYKQAGVAMNQLVLGVPFYGRSFANVGSSNNGLFQSFNGTPQGTFESGVYEYKDLAANYFNQGDWTRYYDEISRVPYLYSPSQKVLISYDDPQSLKEKVEFMKNQGLSGVMIWSIDADTPNGDLINAIDSSLRP